MATYVLVHGATHGGWCYGRVAPLLRAAGHDVHTPTLTGLGERSHLLSPRVDLELHVTDVVQLLHSEDLRDVILVGHSYGGMVVTGVADRSSDRIAHLVYLDAPIPRNGEALDDLVPEPMAIIRSQGQVVDGVELVLFPGTAPLGFFGVTDPTDIACMRPRLTPHPWRTFEQPLRLEHEAALWAIPQTVIACTSSMARRDQSRFELARAAGRLFEIDTGHDLMITEPAATAELLLRVASG